MSKGLNVVTTICHPCIRCPAQLFIQFLCSFFVSVLEGLHYSTPKWPLLLKSSTLPFNVGSGFGFSLPAHIFLFPIASPEMFRTDRHIGLIAVVT